MAKEIVVISGKGGTGKTTLVGSFAHLASQKVMVDCDVDASDLHLLLNPRVREEHEFYGGSIASIDKEKCSECGFCESMCRFEGIKDFQVNSLNCEGCHFCYHLCPEGAIEMKEEMAAKWYLSETRHGPLIHGRMGIGAENSGKLVAALRRKSWELAREEGARYIISDGPPGIGCPVIASITGADLALIITEPSLSGLHDLERIADTSKHFRVPLLACINKYDLHEGKSQEVEDFCGKKDIKVAARIGFDPGVSASLVEGVPLTEYSQGRASREVKSLWQEILNNL